MKLLIADDEVLTRDGLITSIDWESLGVREIFQADDGIKALQIASREKPDIILSDIRMPRLTGIQMAQEIEKILPDTSLIFMSGYSDKEYLKAAIKLKAVTYVEKPLNPDEIRQAVSDARKQRQEKLRTRQNEELYSKETAARLAFLLTRPYREHEEEISSLIDELHISMKPGCTFTTYIIKSKLTDIDSFTIKEFRKSLDEFLHSFHLSAFYIQLHSVHYTFHIMSETTPSATVFSSIEQYLKEKSSVFGEHFIARGETVSGISKVYQSYTDAVIVLQSSFFFDPGSILISHAKDDEIIVPRETELPDHFITLLSDALLCKNEAACTDLTSQLYQLYHENRLLLPNQIKDIYYKLFNLISDCRQKIKLPASYEGNHSEHGILACMEHCFSFQELHAKLTGQIRDYFHSVNNYEPEDATIFIIKDYIGKNYMKETLSIKEISDHVFLSASYVCTYFKTQTGQTLNQYLTQYRMEKAMQLLSDSRYQIADISSKVGYSNGNYFSKSFRKFTGLSPSKYREKILE